MTARVLFLAALLLLSATPATRAGQPDFSPLASELEIGPDGKRAPAASEQSGRSGIDNKRKLHLKGLGLGYDVNKRLTVEGGFTGMRPAAEDTQPASGKGIFIGLRRNFVPR